MSSTQIPARHVDGGRHRESTVEIDLLGPNDTQVTHKGKPIWAPNDVLVSITTDDEDHPLYGEQIQVRLSDLRVAILTP